MNTLTPNRILQKGDEYRNNGEWKPVPDNDFGLQVQFTTYKEVRRPSEKPPKNLGNGESLPSLPVPSGRLTPEGVALKSSGSRVESRPVSQPISQDGGERPAANAESEKTPAPTHSGTGDTPLKDVPAQIDEATRLAHAVSHLPTVVSKKAHALHQSTRMDADGKIYQIGETPETVRPTEAPKRAAPPTPPKVKCIPPCVIEYPAGSGCIWTGRNGTFKGYGIEISKLDDKVMLFPFGKRGIGNCTIQFPVDVIPQIIDRLNHYNKTPK